MYPLRKGEEGNIANMKSFGTIFNKIARDIGLESGRKINSIRKQWHNLVGETIAIHAYPETIRGDMLVLAVETPQWMHHLTFYKEEITLKLNAFGIKRVNFRLGKLPDSCNTAHNDKEVLLTEDDRRYLNDTLKDINDKELKEGLKKLLIHGLTKGKRID